MNIRTNRLLALGIAGVLTACGGNGSTDRPATQSTTSTALTASHAGATISSIFSAKVSAAPKDGEEVDGIVRLEVRGAQLANVELLPANGYQPKYGVFRVSPDKTHAWLDFDTSTLPDGKSNVRISAFNVPAGQSGAKEIIAMPSRTWTIANDEAGRSNDFAAEVMTAPGNDETVAGITRLEITGEGIANAELLPATGYAPRLGVLNVSEDKKHAWLDFDTRSLPDGLKTVRIAAFNVTEGQKAAQEITAMSERSWHFGNGSGGGFQASVTKAPAHGAYIDGTVRLEVRGKGLKNVELLSAAGYEPKLGTFVISADRTFAYLDVDSSRLPQGTFNARISAFDAPAGSSGAREIIAMPTRQWTTPNEEGLPVEDPGKTFDFVGPIFLRADANGNF